MKYCIDYNKNFKYNNKVDEIKLNYSIQKEDALSFIDSKKDKTIVLYIENIIDFFENKEYELFSDLYKEKTNFKVLFSDLDLVLNKYSNELEKCNFNFFFSRFVNSWDLFLGLVSLKVCDIYIVEELCFELDKISAIAKENDISIRCFPNVAQSQWKDCNLKSFFIRPEDLKIYENYIDILEFLGDKSKNNLYYEIYAIDKKWEGRLDEIIIGLNSDIDSRYMIPDFADRRIKCGKNCLKGGKCKMCETILQLSKTLEKANIRYNNKEE